MSLVDQTLWISIGLQLRQSLPQVIYDQWFAQAEVLSWDGRNLEIGVQNRFFKSRIETTYVGALKQAAEAVVGVPVTVTISVSSRLFAAFRESQEKAEAEASSLELDFQSETAHPPPPPPPKPLYGLELNPDFTFENFVVGSSNRLSHAVSLRALETPGEYTRLYFCGQHGVGKTHLLQAICSQARLQRPDLRVVYVTCERFVADFGAAYAGQASGRLKEFRNFYRSVDLLAFDELQALGAGNKSATQTELLSIIDELSSKGKQIVFAATLAPEELEGVDAKIRDRLVAGFVDRLSLPDEETRRALIVRKMEEKRIDLPSAAVKAIARELSGNVRKLEGTVSRLAALMDIEGMEPTLSCIRMALEVSTPASKKSALVFKDVIQAVADEYGLTSDAIVGRGRAQTLRRARQLAMLLCRQLIGGSYAELGEVFGKRSHATIMTALKNIPAELFSSGLESRPVERILFRLGVGVKPEELFARQRGLFD